MRAIKDANPDIFDLKYDYDAEISTDEIDLELANALTLLEPCGKGNEVPAFLLKDAKICNWRFLKNEDKMARFAIRGDDGRYIDAVLFSGAADAYELVQNRSVDILGSVEINVWRDEARVQMVVRQVLESGTL